MCLGVPGQITEMWTNPLTDLPMARVDFGGIAKEICLAFEPDTAIGEYVMVHVGFAISRIDEAEAQQILSVLSQMDALEEISAGDTETQASIT